MIFLLLLVSFAIAAMATGALSHDERKWRYAAGLTVATAATLTWRSAELLISALHFISCDIHPVTAGLLAAGPYAWVVVDLWVRRQHTPRHAPGPDDDPVLRRYLEEKLRRHRRRRHAEELEFGTDTPVER
jgi:hypothetical protein